MSRPNFNPKILNERKLTLVGYGAQGRAEALCLRRSGVNFALALRPGGASWQKAVQDGFVPADFEAALTDASDVALNIPDEAQRDFFETHLQTRTQIERLVFAHGFSTHFGRIAVEKAQHVLVAPKGAAGGLIEFYQTPQALPAILAARPKASATDQVWIETYALALGCHPKALVWADFKDEAECDLFSEQVLLCGGVSNLLMRSFEVLIEAGYNPETAYFETVYELKLIVDIIWKEGISGMRSRISPTARFGDLTRGSRVIDESVKSRMSEILREIQSGQFTKEFLNDSKTHESKKIFKKDQEHLIEKIGADLRARIFQSN